MRTARKHTGISEQEYLEGERAAEVKHEYVAGQVFAMTGASLVHATIALNLGTALRSHVRGRPCRAFVSDVKVRIPDGPTHYYPDLVVTCDARDLPVDAKKDYVEHPSLLVEVLSPTTVDKDRREKLNAYRKLPSLREYVLISQEYMLVDAYRRDEKGWLHTALGAGDTLELQSVGLQVAVDEVYAETGVA